LASDAGVLEGIENAKSGAVSKLPNTFPILEFDEEREAVIEPSKAIKHRDVPERCVVCYFRQIIDQSSQQLALRALRPVKCIMGEIPVYSGTYDGQEFAILPGAVGAPLAVGCLEEIIARGGRKFIVCGSAGVLDQSIASGHIVVPTSALRDEGTSYHYLTPGRKVKPTPEALEAIRATLNEHGCRYVEGKTWTTDAFYRETRSKVAKRRSEGCITVEMEAAAFFAVARFRGVQLAQVLYGSDDVSSAEWDPREMGKETSVREALFWMALKACIRL